MIRKIILSGITATMLVGCASPMENYVAKRCRNEISFSGLVSGNADACFKREEANYQCENYGFIQGTADFSRCLMTIDSERKIRREISSEAERTRSMMLFK